MKKFVAYTKEKFPTRIEIVEDNPDVGFYIYVTPGDSSKEDKDFLQDTLEIAFEFAEEEYGVKREEFKEVKD